MNASSHDELLSDRAIVACPQCDLLQRLGALAPGESARCTRCDGELWRLREDSLDRTLALSLAAAVLYLVANTIPMLGLSVVGRQASTTVLGGAERLWQDGRPMEAGLVLLTSVVAPGLQIVFMLAIVVAGRRERPPRWVGKLLRQYPTIRTWSMVEVMLLGVLVALVKIADYATIVPGVPLFALAVLGFLLAGIEASFDPRGVWERIEWAEGGRRGRVPEMIAAEARS